MIEIKNVSNAYGPKNNRFMVLDNVSFTIPDGKTVAVIGKSGSGKSSLMNVMSGLTRPDLGEVLIDGQDILEMSERQVDAFRIAKMGFIFQSFFVQSNQSCYENVSLPLEIMGIPQRRRQKLVQQALDAVGLGDKKSTWAVNLSGGQKQRLAVARAIVNRPRILFADEPTGNLDTVTGEAIENLLFWCVKHYNITLIMVTHDPELAAKCDMQIEIKDGKVGSINGQSAAMNRSLLPPAILGVPAAPNPTPTPVATVAPATYAYATPPSPMQPMPQQVAAAPQAMMMPPNDHSYYATYFSQQPAPGEYEMSNGVSPR